MSPPSHALYRAQEVETAGPAQLVLLLYNAALAALTQARQADGRPDAVHVALVRVQDIVAELRYGLDRERGGDLAGSLDALYAYCEAQLVEANLTKDLTRLAGPQRVLQELRDAWEEACCSVAGTP